MDTRPDNSDFEYWRRLAAEDPAAFEIERERAISALIKSVPEPTQRRMQGLQWRIDRMREQADNPMAACVRLSSMMWDSLLGAGGLLETMRKLEGIDPQRAQTRQPAKVIPINRTR